MRKRIPNLLSFIRLGSAPVMIAAAWLTGSRAAFLTVLGLALLTDALDGQLDRRHLEELFVTVHDHGIQVARCVGGGAQRGGEK